MDRLFRNPCVVILSILAVAVVASPGCGLFGGGKDIEPSMTQEEAGSGGREEVSAQSREEMLRDAVEKHIAQAGDAEDFEKAPLVKHDPYFLKEVSEYPAGATGMEVSIRETESRMAPMVADVTVPKKRFATEMHRKKDDAREDTTFYRETGNETLTYQWRNGRWVQVASLFVVDTKEERVGGEWREVEPVVEEDVILRDDDRGFFQRMFGGIFGR